MTLLADRIEHNSGAAEFRSTNPDVVYVTYRRSRKKVGEQINIDEVKI